MRVMFVDDEAQVLKGITRMLDAADVDWEVETAIGGPEALAALADKPVDVLVTDMKMPGMDGARLLEEVSSLHPQTVRIILSGQANKEAVYRAVAPMHQYLAKPCGSDDLRDVVARACSLRETLDATASHDFLGKISTLPSLPRLYQEVVVEMESEHGSLARVGEIIAQDPAMTAKILQLANSAIFGLRHTVTTPAQAASVIGLDTIKSLVLSLQVFKSFDGAPLPGFSIDRLMDHSLRVAAIAQMIAKTEGLSKEASRESFTAGLLHDVGKLILAANAPSEFEMALSMAKAEGISQIEAERNVFGLGHDGIGGYLMALWGIPQSIVESVAFHHRPDQCCGKNLSAPAIVYAANLLANEASGAVGSDESLACEGWLARTGAAGRFEIWRETLRSTDG